MKIKLILFLLPLFVFAQNDQKSLIKKMTKEISVNYVLQLPENYNNLKQNWPLIVFLHGSGERGNDLSKVSIHGPLKYINEGNKLDAIILAPQCPETEIWDNDVLYTLIEEVVYKNKVDITRIYLTGLSMGGYGTWNLALDHPKLFAAVVPICAPIMYNFTEKASKLKNNPIWVFHGGKDKVVPVSYSERMVDAIKKSGGNPKFTIYPDAGHDSWSIPYSDPNFYAWMLSQERKIN
ncbi:MAG: prolyl oligopeptidase family serine peptidase [Bacteroidota bacterium]